MASIPENPRVSVILCTYAPDMYDHFQDAADSIFEQTYANIELVIVVDGSDSVADRVESDFGEDEAVTVHCMESNSGLLVCRNKGVELATGDIVAFIDDDAVADEDWIDELVTTFHNTEALAAGGRMIPSWIAGKPDALPEEFYWVVGVTHRGFPDEPAEVRNTFGSNLAFKRDIFLELGGFNTDIGGRQGDKNLQGGETELCSRLRAAYGQGVMYNPQAIVAHKVFEYRTQLAWQVNRAFWQGYSKRVMQSLVTDAGWEESAYSRKILFEFVPERLTDLVNDPSVTSVKQLVTLGLLTGAVGAGYLYGTLTW